MALFTDGEINNLQDLQRIESALLDIANVEQIDLNAKMALAQDQIAGDLLIFLLKQTPRNPFNPILSYQAGSARRLLGVSDVVVTPPLKRWHALKSIEYAYEDAYNNQLNDRYQGKWKQYQQKSSIAAGQAVSDRSWLIVKSDSEGGCTVAVVHGGESTGGYLLRPGDLGESNRSGRCSQRHAAA